MPPKLHRPAAAPRRGLRRPAAAEAPEAAGALWEEPHKVKLEEYAAGTVVVVEGEYWEGAVELAAFVVGAAIEGTQRYLRVKGTGTKSEAILKFLTGASSRVLYLHLCSAPCDAKTWREDLVHVKRFKKVTEVKEPWMENLGEEPRAAVPEEDQNEQLRKEAEKAHAELQRREEVAKEKRAGESKKDAKKKKKKKRKKEDQQPKASDGRKSLALAYGGTGLDPDPAIRKKVVKKARKIRKKGRKSKRRRSSSTGSSSSSTASSSSSEILLDLELFEGERESHRLWRRTTGALTLATIMEAQQTLLTRQGVHPEVHTSSVPPILVQYFRNNLQPQMGPALSRESHNWAMLVDLMLQGELARACDLACQRIKSLESYSKGITLDIARNLELVPPDKSSLTSQTETTLAGKLALEEQKIHSKTRYQGGKGGEPSYRPPGNQKGKTKGDGKKGKNDSKGPRKGKEDEKDRGA